VLAALLGSAELRAEDVVPLQEPSSGPAKETEPEPSLSAPSFPADTPVGEGAAESSPEGAPITAAREDTHETQPERAPIPVQSLWGTWMLRCALLVAQSSALGVAGMLLGTLPAALASAAIAGAMVYVIRQSDTPPLASFGALMALWIVPTALTLTGALGGAAVARLAAPWAAWLPKSSISRVRFALTFDAMDAALHAAVTGGFAILVACTVGVTVWVTSAGYGGPTLWGVALSTLPIIMLCLLLGPASVVGLAVGAPLVAMALHDDGT
jgi:hypothetical protein